ncbi:hypothetical protein [Mycobacterium sp. URHB0021]
MADAFVTMTSRFEGHPGLPSIGRIKTPLWATTTITLGPKHPRTEEVNGSEDMHAIIGVVGAAWLLMSQPNLSQTRVTEPAHVPTASGADAATMSAVRRDPASVTIVELHREIAQNVGSTGGKPKRQFRGRWMVGWPNGYWCQQAYGPGHSLQKPILIAPHTAGPRGAPLIPPKQKVHVWRR